MATQQYPKVLFEIKPSKIHKDGVGIFAVVNIKKGERIAKCHGKEALNEIVPWTKFRLFSKEFRKKVMNYCVGTPYGFIPPKGMDFNNLAIGWHFNHSCDGNMGFNGKCEYVAVRNIKKGEELSFDYGLLGTYPKIKLKCSCGSNKCRKVITGNDWKILMKDNSKSKYLHPCIELFAYYRSDKSASVKQVL